MGTTVNDLIFLDAAIAQNILMMYEAKTDEMVIYRAFLVLLYREKFSELYNKSSKIVKKSYSQVVYFSLLTPMEMK